MGNLERRMGPTQSEMQQRVAESHERLDFYSKFDPHLIHMSHCMTGSQLRPYGLTMGLANQLSAGLAKGEFPIEFDSRKFYDLEALQEHAIAVVKAGYSGTDWRAQLKVEKCEDCRVLLEED